MRCILVLAIAIALPGFALAQNGNAYTNDDPECAPVFQQRALEAAQRSQEDLARDLQVMDPFFRNIKENPRTEMDKMLSCVDVNWPDLPFSGSFGMNIEEYLATEADRMVDEACSQMRDQYRRIESTFSTVNLRRRLMDELGLQCDQLDTACLQRRLLQEGGIQCDALDTDCIRRQIEGRTGGSLPPQIDRVLPPNTGIGDLIRPRPSPNPTPPGGGVPIGP